MAGAALGLHGGRPRARALTKQADGKDSRWTPLFDRRVRSLLECDGGGTLIAAPGAGRPPRCKYLQTDSWEVEAVIGLVCTLPAEFGEDGHGYD